MSAAPFSATGARSFACAGKEGAFGYIQPEVSGTEIFFFSVFHNAVPGRRQESKDRHQYS
ncbi:hypothetical protein ECDEC6E_5293 [Escherichia coli DEC6E]|nr:hypothetical protein ECDEC6E_5293 [Escherichia coli DEC6E]